MTVKYRYTQAGRMQEGEMQRTTDMVDSHDIVLAVVQQTANDTGETVLISMLDPTGTFAIGTHHANPENIENTGRRTMENLEISEDGGKTWLSVVVRS